MKVQVWNINLFSIYYWNAFDLNLSRKMQLIFLYSNNNYYPYLTATFFQKFGLSSNIENEGIKFGI